MTLARQRRFRRRLLRTIARYSASGHESAIAQAQIEAAVERYLTSHGTQSAIRHQLWVRSHGEAEAKQLWDVAQRAPIVPFDYRRSRSKMIRYCHSPRSTGGVRKICTIPETLKMFQTMAHDLIVEQHTPKQHIGDWRGRGRDWQIDQISAALTSPNQAVVSADIKQAFASVDFDAVYELRYLPEQLTRRVLDYRSHTFSRRERSEHVREVIRAACHDRHDDDWHIVLERTPSGLMEGSPASNAIFSVLMDDLPDHLEEGIQAFVYCDNIILIAPSMSCAQRAEDALARYLAGHRAGPFEMRSALISVSDGFEHLGYRLRRLPGLPTDVGISRNGWLKLVDRLFEQPCDLDETVQWVIASYNRCHRSSWHEFMRLAERVASRSH